MRVDDLRAIARELDVRVGFVAGGRGGDLDRLLSARHSAMHEVLATMFADLPDWIAAPEVTFSVWGERGTIDILAWHPGRRALLVIELKTEITDVQDLVGSVDRYRRLAPAVARERGWESPATVSCWVVVARSRTNERRIAAHGTMLRSAFPDDGRRMAAWLRDPVAAVACLSTLSDPDDRLAPQQRVRRPTRVRHARAA